MLVFALVLSRAQDLDRSQQELAPSSMKLMNPFGELVCQSGPLNEVFGPFEFVSLTARSREADLEIIVRAGGQAQVAGWSAARLKRFAFLPVLK